MTLMDPGTYNARATAAALGYSSKGTEQVAVDFEITASPSGQYDGAHMTWYGYFSDAAVERTMESLVACGCTSLNELHLISRNEVRIDVKHEAHPETGEVRARIAFVNKLGGIAMKNRMSENEAKAFAARMNGKFLAVSKKLGGASSSPNAQPSQRSAANPRPVSKGSPHDPPASTMPVDDDIPF